MNFEEDNVASSYKDYEGWTIDRKRAWVTLLSGAHYDIIDFVHAKPIANWLKEKPEHLLAAVFAVPGKDYNIYLADERELTDKDAGQPIRTYSPETGLYSPRVSIKGSKDLQFYSPEIQGDSFMAASCPLY